MLRSKCIISVFWRQKLVHVTGLTHSTCIFGLPCKKFKYPNTHRNWKQMFYGVSAEIGDLQKYLMSSKNELSRERVNWLKGPHYWKLLFLNSPITSAVIMTIDGFQKRFSIRTYSILFSFVPKWIQRRVDDCESWRALSADSCRLWLNGTCCKLNGCVRLKQGGWQKSMHSVWLAQVLFYASVTTDVLQNFTLTSLNSFFTRGTACIYHIDLNIHI